VSAFADLVSPAPVRGLGYEPPSAKFRRNATWFLGFSAVFVVASSLLGFDPLLFVRDFHLVMDVAERAFPPNLELLWTKRGLFASLGQTVAMAFFGTVAGCFIALALSFLAASNTAPHPRLRAATRGLFALERSLPSFVVMIVFQIAVGVGAFSACLALVVGSIGSFGKLFSEAIESVDKGPCESVAAAGATRAQETRYAILPAALPALAGIGFYAFDVNLRQAIALGVYGGGGIGFELLIAQKTLRHDDMLALVILIIALIAAMERLSDLLRKRLIGEQALR